MCLHNSYDYEIVDDVVMIYQQYGDVHVYDHDRDYHYVHLNYDYIYDYDCVLRVYVHVYVHVHVHVDDPCYSTLTSWQERNAVERVKDSFYQLRR